LLKYRKTFLLDFFDKNKLTFPIHWEERFLPEEILNTSKNFNISLKEMSLSLKHENTLINQLEQNIETIIIFEDDIDVNSIDNLQEYLNKCFSEFKENKADILWLGGTKLLDVPSSMIENGKYCYFSSKFTSRCTHAYMISLKAANIVLKNYHYNLPVDHLYNEIIKKTNLISGWTSPFLSQKTVDGIWNSSIR